MPFRIALSITYDSSQDLLTDQETGLRQIPLGSILVVQTFPDYSLDAQIGKGAHAITVPSAVGSLFQFHPLR